MPDRMIDEPRLKPLVASIEKIVKSDGIEEKFVRPSESKDSVAEDAVREIASNVSSFEDWYFDTEDPRTARLTVTGNHTVPTKYDDLAATVKDIVEYNLTSMREVDELTVEPDVDHLINQLVNYILNWEKWYYDYKTERNRTDWFADEGLNDDIYLETDYGDEDKSQGRGNLYMAEDEPPPPL